MPAHRLAGVAPGRDHRRDGARLKMRFFPAVMSMRFYGQKQALKNISIDIGRRQQVLAMIGPSGCGKSTFLRCLNAQAE